MPIPFCSFLPQDCFHDTDPGKLQKTLDLLLLAKQGLDSVLELPFKSFSEEVTINVSLVSFLNTFLQHARRKLDPYAKPDSITNNIAYLQYCDRYEEVFFRVFALYSRVSSNARGSKSFAAACVSSKLVTFPIIMDISSLYYPTNPTLCQTVVTWLFSLSDSFMTAFSTTIGVLNRTVSQIHDMLLEPLSKESIEDIVYYVHDIALTIESFVNSCPSSLDPLPLTDDLWENKSSLFHISSMIFDDIVARISSLLGSEDGESKSMNATVHTALLHICRSCMSTVETLIVRMHLRRLNIEWNPATKKAKRAEVRMKDSGYSPDTIVDSLLSLLLYLPEDRSSLLLGTYWNIGHMRPMLIGVRDCVHSIDPVRIDNIVSLAESMAHSVSDAAVDSMFQSFVDDLKLPGFADGDIEPVDEAHPSAPAPPVGDNRPRVYVPLADASALTQLCEIFPDYGSGFLAHCYSACSEDLERTVSLVMTSNFPSTLEKMNRKSVFVASPDEAYTPKAAEDAVPHIDEVVLPRKSKSDKLKFIPESNEDKEYVELLKKFAKKYEYDDDYEDELDISGGFNIDKATEARLEQRGKKLEKVVDKKGRVTGYAVVEDAQFPYPDAAPWLRPDYDTWSAHPRSHRIPLKDEGSDESGEEMNHLDSEEYSKRIMAIVEETSEDEEPTESYRSRSRNPTMKPEKEGADKKLKFNAAATEFKPSFGSSTSPSHSGDMKKKKTQTSEKYVKKPAETQGKHDTRKSDDSSRSTKLSQTEKPAKSVKPESRYVKKREEPGLPAATHGDGDDEVDGDDRDVGDAGTRGGRGRGRGSMDRNKIYRDRYRRRQALRKSERGYNAPGSD